MGGRTGSALNLCPARRGRDGRVGAIPLRRPCCALAVARPGFTVAFIKAPTDRQSPPVGENGRKWRALRPFRPEASPKIRAQLCSGAGKIALSGIGTCGDLHQIKGDNVCRSFSFDKFLRSQNDGRAAETVFRPSKTCRVWTDLHDVALRRKIPQGSAACADSKITRVLTRIFSA